jgi:hypothetical protein
MNGKLSATWHVWKMGSVSYRNLLAARENSYRNNIFVLILLLETYLHANSQYQTALKDGFLTYTDTVFNSL